MTNNTRVTMTKYKRYCEKKGKKHLNNTMEITKRSQQYYGDNKKISTIL